MKNLNFMLKPFENLVRRIKLEYIMQNMINIKELLHYLKIYIIYYYWDVQFYL